MDLATENNTSNGTIATLAFEILETAEVGDNEISVSYNPNEIYDIDYNNVHFGSISGLVTVLEPPSVESITIDKSPSLINFNTGDTFEVDGSLSLTYSDGTTKEKQITVDMCSGYDMSQAGTQTVTIIENGMTVTYDITVSESVIVPFNMSFLDGEVIIWADAGIVPNNADFSVVKIVPPPEDAVEKIQDKYGSATFIIGYYDITLQGSDGLLIKTFDGDLTISIRLPEEYVEDDSIHICQEDADGNLVELNYWFEDRYICFTTNRL
jgi:hypothetical protein